MRIFISFSSKDRETARRLDASLRNRRPDFECFFDERRLQGGDYWIPELGEEVAKADAVVLLLGRTIGKWQELEYYEALQLSRRPERGGRPRIVPVAITGGPSPGLAFLSTLHQISAPDLQSEIALSALERALDAIASREDWRPWTRFAPYKGLAALTETDAAFFFGREKETADVLDLLARARGRVVTLIGHSGVGKSSLVLAGVLSRLKSQLPPLADKAWPQGLSDSRSYQQLTMKPGKDPVKELAASFVALYGTDGPSIEGEAKRWADQLRTGSNLTDMLRQTRVQIADAQNGHVPKHFILYVDQGEELYTRAAPDEAALFSRLVADAATEDIFSIVMSLRSDFYSKFQSDVLFGISEKFDVLPLTRKVLIDVIRKPAELLHARFENDLMPSGFADATDQQAGALPLLSDLLHGMWSSMQARGDGVLRWEDQPGIFDITLPLERRAEKYMSLPTTDERVVRRLFTLRLAQVGTVGDPMRRRARKSECSSEEWAVAERLAGPDERLLTISASNLGETIVEVAHEQLLERWPRLAGWLEEERKFLVWRTEAEQELEKYRAQHDERKSDALLMGLRLTAAEEWLAVREADLDPDLCSYVQASAAHRTAQENEKRASELRLKEIQIELERSKTEDALDKARRASRRARVAVRSALSLVALLLLSVLLPVAGLAWFPETMRTLVPDAVAPFIPPQIPVRPPVKRAIWLNQNWSNEDRHWFHHASVGTTLPIPYAWFVALERPEVSPTLFGDAGQLADSSYLERFGFIPSPRSVRGSEGSLLAYGYGSGDPRASGPPEVENPHSLPVGFARTKGATDPATAAPLPDQIGLTCAACHTGHIEYKGTSLRFDGGPAMIDLPRFEVAMGLAILYTVYFPQRFERFAERVLGMDAKKEDRARLRSQLLETGNSLVEENKIVVRSMARKGSATGEGYGRLDWLTRIGNQIFYSDLASGGMKGFEKNILPPRAPVSFPPLWTVPWFARGGSVTSSNTLLYSMTAEALGAAALVDLVGVSELGAQYRSSIPVENLAKIEAMLRGPAFNKGLTAPKWPSSAIPDDPAWLISPERVARGRELYRQFCAECHLPPLVDTLYDQRFPKQGIENSIRFKTEMSGDRFLLPVVISAAGIGTDPAQARIAAERTVTVPAYFDIDPARDLGQKRGCTEVKESKNSVLSFNSAMMVLVDRIVTKGLPADTEEGRQAILGMRKDCPDTSREPTYVARPLNGVWATAPYLHNGSVPTLYDLLSPVANRPMQFCIGARDFDPVKVGLSSSSCAKGESIFSASEPGNSNYGHAFEGSSATLPRGVVGPLLREDDKKDLIEYLKTL